MFAYCENNPVNTFDPSGHNGVLSLFGRLDLLGGINIAANPVALFVGVFVAALSFTMDSYVIGDDTLYVSHDSGKVSSGSSSESSGSSTASSPSVSKPKKGLRRPYIRKEVRQTVEEKAPRTADGRPIDPNTRKPIEGKPDLGHVFSHEFWREKAIAESEGLTQREFNDRMNNPDLYQLEDASSIGAVEMR